MEHLGDIMKISGKDALPVDVMIGGSPCQDLSVAGKRAGLAGERSGLFMEQIRLIKEMREHDRNSGRTDVFVRPRFMVWENVPGAFSSNKGEDFRAVLEETARVAQPDAVIPGPPGRWQTSGCILGDGWSIAWRVLDAQFWGVPQRRRRIALVADFGGNAAPEILFVRKSVCGGVEEGETAREASAKGIGESAFPPVAKGLTARYDGSTDYDRGPNIVCVATQQGGAEIRTDDKAPTLTAAAGMSGNNQPFVMATGQTNAEVLEDKAPTLNCNHEAPILAPGGPGIHGEIAGTPDASYYKGTGSRNGQEREVIYTYRAKNTVRRLTPLECERLQGFPDGWTDIGTWTDAKGKSRETSDAARYKALGNSIAIPPWAWVLKRLCACYERPATMASLFDGIGGFPLIWERLNGPGTCMWASEIEEFPIAVTKKHFGKSSATSTKTRN